MQRGMCTMSTYVAFRRPFQLLTPLLLLALLTCVTGARAAPAEATSPDLVASPGGSHARAIPVAALPVRITLAQALELLRHRSPRAKAARAQVEVAAAERISARAYPNPTFGYSGLALALGANLGALWEHQLAVEQPILLFGQRRARGRLAEANVNAARARVASELQARSLAVREAFVALLGHQERVRLLMDSKEDLKRVEKIVRGRKAAGDQSLYDVARIELEVESHRLELERAETDLVDASGKLAALLGLPGYRPRAAGTLDPVSMPGSPGELWRQAQRQHPAILAAQAMRVSAQRELRVARTDRLPVPSAVLGVNLTQDERSTSVIFGLSIPLPIFDRGQGAIAYASASVTAESRALDAELAELQAELERAHGLYRRRLATLRVMEERTLRRLPELRRMAEKSYREAGSTFLDLLDAFRTIKGLKLAHLEQREAVKLAEVQVMAAAAIEPDSWSP